MANATLYRPATLYFHRALKEVGIPALQGMNSGNLLGGQYSAMTINPEDQTPFASTRTKLIVYPRILVKQMTFDGNKTTTAVRVNSNVLFSQILQASGVGPKSRLFENKVTVVADQPGVGQNMWNELANQGYKYQAEQEYIYNSTGMPTNMAADFLGKSYCQSSRSSDNLVQALKELPKKNVEAQSGSARSGISQLASEWPEIGYVISILGYAGVLPGKNYGTIYGGKVTHLSRGTSMIQSKQDGQDLAVIDSKAKVIGVNHLRAVDASTFPLLPPGHPQSAICSV
ncbi:hypothetical protein BJ878DRAFT_480070 [Calycina marina]|uniref:Glucose-methanol-choline oxidoreductase C-terminal domain-containing protein n=1 Tax=Calycina marina TaxID=1763456 RepID=A0A9P7Z3L9_9HELO|nr:hypothetical protein BJ878DRAFT_480070 [Calycina marina]